MDRMIFFFDERGEGKGECVCGCVWVKYSKFIEYFQTLKSFEYFLSDMCAFELMESAVKFKKSNLKWVRGAKCCGNTSCGAGWIYLFQFFFFNH